MVYPRNAANTYPMPHALMRRPAYGNPAVPPAQATQISPQYPMPQRSAPGLQQPGPAGMMPPQHGLPAAQDLALNTDGPTPDQLAALQSQFPPAMVQAAAQMMQNPQVRAQMAQLQDMAQKGQLSPEMLQQMAAAGALPGAAGLGMPPGPGSGTPFNPMSFLKTTALTLGIGYPACWTMDAFLAGAHDPKSIYSRMLKGLQSFKPIQALDQKLNNRLDALSLNALPESFLGRMTDHYRPEQTVKNYLQTYLGPSGALTPDIHAIPNLPAALKTQVMRAETHADLMRLFEADPRHCLPKAAQELVQPAPGFLARMIPGPIRSWWAGDAERMTLKQLERLTDQAHFTAVLEQATKSNLITAKNQQALQSALTALSVPNGTMPAEAFVNRMQQLARHSEFGPLVRKVLKIDASVTRYSDLSKAIRAAAGVGEKGACEMLQSSSKAVLSRGLPSDLAALEKMTLAQLKAHFQKYHFASALNKGAHYRDALGQLRGQISGLLGRVAYIEEHHLPLAKTEFTLAEELSQQGIGPIGRLLGKFGKSIQRVFEGGNMSRSAAGKVIVEKAHWIPRLFAVGLTFGTSISETRKAPEGTKTAKFVEQFSRSTAGFYGFLNGAQFIHQSGILTRNKAFAKFCSGKLLDPAAPLELLGKINSFVERKIGPLAPVARFFKGMGERMPGFVKTIGKRCPGWIPSWGGFLGEVVGPAIIAGLFERTATYLSHLLAGDPDKILQRIQFKQDQTRKLPSKNGLFDALSNRVPPESVFDNQSVPWTAEVPKLSRERIMQNPVAVAYQKRLGEMEKKQDELEDRMWTHGGHFSRH